MNLSRRDRVLIVEDDVLNLELLQTVLEGAGFDVLGAPDAPGGLDAARRLQPDAILMDLQLPGMNGLEAAQALQADPATAAIPLIAVTAHVKRDDEAQCLAAGFVRHIAKPVDTRSLPGMLREIIAAGRAAAPAAEAAKGGKT